MIIMITICIVQCHWYISYLWCQMFIHLSRKAYLVQKVCKIKNNCGCLQHDGLFWSKRRSRGGNCTLTLMRGQNPEYKGSPISKSICDCKWNESPPPLQCSIPTFPIFLEQMHVCLWFFPSDILRDLPLRQQKTKDPLCHLLRLPCLELLVILSQVLVLR